MKKGRGGFEKLSSRNFSQKASDSDYIYKIRTGKNKELDKCPPKNADRLIIDDARLRIRTTEKQLALLPSL